MRILLGCHDQANQFIAEVRCPEQWTAFKQMEQNGSNDADQSNGPSATLECSPLGRSRRDLESLQDQTAKLPRRRHIQAAQ
jgi:hypothetical protein